MLFFRMLTFFLLNNSFVCVLQCSLSCEGGVKTRAVKCVAKQPGQCDPANRPRSTILCNLQSCSSDNKWTGSPFRPRFRPRVPPKISNTPPNPTTVTDYTTQTSIPLTATTPSDFIHEEDQGFILVKNVEEDMGGREKGPAEEEEGSTDLTPDKTYTPGYDYIVGEEERKDDFIPTRTPPYVQTTAGTSLHVSHPTTVTSPNVHTTKQVTKTCQTTVPPVLSSSTFKWVSSSKLPSTATHVTDARQREPVHTVKIPIVTTNTMRHVNGDLKVSKAVKQRPETVGSTGDYGNLNAPNPVRRNAFWEVGNWSDVRTHMSSLFLDLIVRRKEKGGVCFSQTGVLGGCQGCWKWLLG